MKMRLVPSEATEEMRDAAQEAVHCKISENGATRAVNAAIAAAPHAGKVSAEMLEAAASAVLREREDGGGHYSIAIAVLEAIGLEVEG